MYDFLRVARRFKSFHSALSVHLVEVSPALRQKQVCTSIYCASHLIRCGQQQVLGCVTPPQQQESKPVDSAPVESAIPLLTSESRWTKEGLQVHWHGKLGDVPEHPTILIAQEFLDALPVHQFEVCCFHHGLPLLLLIFIDLRCG